MRQFYLWLIPVTIGLMLLHNAGDWVRKLYRLRLSRDSAVAGVRLRANHEVRMLALRTDAARGAGDLLPDAGLDRLRPEISRISGGRARCCCGKALESVRSLIHRVAAVVFMAVAMMHAISLLASRTLAAPLEGECLPKAQRYLETASAVSPTTWAC